MNWTEKAQLADHYSD